MHPHHERFLRRILRRAPLGLTLLLVVPLGGCLSLNTTVDWEDGTDFEAYATFSVERTQPLDADGTQFDDPARSKIVDRRAFARIRERLTEKGLVEAPAADADLNVGYHVAVRETAQATSQPGHVRWMRVDVREIHYETYTHGTVVVDIADREQHLLVWHGAVQATVKTTQTPGDNLEKAIDRLLSKYPPRWKKY